MSMLNVAKLFIKTGDFFLLRLWFNIPVNSYGHVEMLSQPNHTFPGQALTKWLTSTPCTYFPCIVPS